MYAEYGHAEYMNALEDFCTQLPGGRDDYREAVRRFADHLYARASGDRLPIFWIRHPATT